MDFRKSSFSMNGGNCIEVASGVIVRDSKYPVVNLTFSSKSWNDFINTIK